LLVYLFKFMLFCLEPLRCDNEAVFLFPEPLAWGRFFAKVGKVGKYPEHRV